jgi:hypothetical protein
MALPRASRRSNEARASSSFPASIRERSRMPSIRSSRASDDSRSNRRYFRCCGPSSVESSRSEAPTMAFIGVRISWLMFARKSLLARLALSAVSLAARRASSASFWRVTSRTVAWRIGRPSSSSRVSSTVAGNSEPSIRRCVHSKKWEPSRSAVAIRSWAASPEGVPSGWCSGERSAGEQDVNSASSRQPKSSTADGFPARKPRAGSVIMIASREES